MDHCFFCPNLMVHPKWYPNFDLYDLEMLMDKSSGEKPVGMTQVIWDAMGFNENASFLGFFWTMGQAKPRKKTHISNKVPSHVFVLFILSMYFPTSPRASQSMSFAEMGLKGRCAEGLFNAEHSTAECLWKCRWIYGRGICRTISLSHLRFFLHFTPWYTQELWAAMLENKIAVSKREQAWAIVSKALKGTCKGPKRYVKALKRT